MAHQFRNRVDALLADGRVCNCCSFRQRVRVRATLFLICTVLLCLFSVVDFVEIIKSLEGLFSGAAKGTSSWMEKREHSVLTDGPASVSAKEQTEKNGTNTKTTIGSVDAASANGLSNAGVSDRAKDSNLTVSPIVHNITNYSVVLTDRSHNTSSTNTNDTTTPVSKRNTSSGVNFNASLVARYHNKTHLELPQVRPSKTAAAKRTQTAATGGAAQPTKKPTGIVKEPIVAPASCRRPCSYYNNIIVFSSWNKEGLRDRLTIVDTLSQLAGYLCARIYLSRPRFWLATKHNQGREVDVRMTWNEFVLTRFFDEGSNSSALVDWVNQENVSFLPLIENITKSPKYENWLHVRTVMASDTVDHVERLEAFSFSGVDQSTHPSKQHPQGFIWEIQAYYFAMMRALTQHMTTRRHPSTISPDGWTNYSSNASTLPVKWRRDMQPFAKPIDIQTLNSGCQYATSIVPNDAQQLVQRIFDFVRENVTTSTRHESVAKRDKDTTPISPQPLIGYYHVRRGDSAYWCNTSLGRVEQYLNCSLGESLKTASPKTTQRRHVVLLFSSDESDEKYRNGIARLVKQQERYEKVIDKFSVSFVDLDDLGQAIISDAIRHEQIPAWRFNNVYLYHLVYIIEQGRPEVSFRLEQRRHVCPSCVHLNFLTM